MKTETEVQATTPEDYIANWIKLNQLSLHWETCGASGIIYSPALSNAKGECTDPHFKASWKGIDYFSSDHTIVDEIFRLGILQWLDLKPEVLCKISEALKNEHENEAISLLECYREECRKNIVKQINYLTKDWWWKAEHFRLRFNSAPKAYDEIDDCYIPPIRMPFNSGRETGDNLPF